MLYSIQYVRAIAVLMVLIVHTFGWGGAQGVDIFFVTSGFIMMYIMHHNPRGALEFFLSRFLRVAPIYYIATLVALLIGLGNEPTLEHIIHSFFFLKLKWSSPVLSIGWTLEYEFVFYVVCSFSLLLTLKYNYRIILVVAILLFLTFILDVVLFPDKAYGFFVEFIFGILIFKIWNYLGKYTDFDVRFLLLLLVSSFLLLFTVQELIYPSGKLPYRFIGYGVFSSIFVLSVILLEDKLPRVGWLKLVGDASYSIYITHTITLYCYYKFFDVNRYYSFLSDTLSFICALFFGFLFHFYVEKPIANNLSASDISKRFFRSRVCGIFPESFLQRLK